MKVEAVPEFCSAQPFLSGISAARLVDFLSYSVELTESELAQEVLCRETIFV